MKSSSTRCFRSCNRGSESNPNFHLVNKSSRVSPHEVLRQWLINTVYNFLVMNNQGRGNNRGFMVIHYKFPGYHCLANYFCSDRLRQKGKPLKQQNCLTTIKTNKYLLYIKYIIYYVLKQIKYLYYLSSWVTALLLRLKLCACVEFCGKSPGSLPVRPRSHECDNKQTKNGLRDY